MQNFRTVMAPHGMVTSPHFLATSAGLQVLERGGNAIEAAIAAASTIAVVYPHMNGIGGDNIWLIYDAKSRYVKSLLACGQAGSKCTPEFYRSNGYPVSIPYRGVLAANTVPGVVDGWWEAYQYSREYMNGTFDFGSLLDRAIMYADNGFPVTHGQSIWTMKNIGSNSGPYGNLNNMDGFSRTFLKPSKQAYRLGDRFHSRDLAQSLKLIADGGRDAFYCGPITEQICSYLVNHGGVLTQTDFEAYRSRWVEPIAAPYRDWVVYNSPAPTQGLTSLQILSMMEYFPLYTWRDDSSLYYHAMVEAAKIAFRDRDAWIADPDFVKIPVSGLLSRGYTSQLASTIDLQRASIPNLAKEAHGDTIWLGVVDKFGNAVSLIQSTYFDFGSGVVVDGTGILLQNRGASFSLNENDANVIAPGKRPFHTLNPAMALRDGIPELIYGTMGGEGQPQTQAAILTRILDLKMNVQAAIDAPRWVYGRTWGAESSMLTLEGRIPDNIALELRGKGHIIQMADPWDERMGHAQAIWIDPETGLLHGGADPRGDGLAAGY